MRFKEYLEEEYVTSFDAKHITGFNGGYTEIFKNPCSRWTIFAGCFRFWSGNAVAYFTGKYFNIYPNNVVRS